VIAGLVLAAGAGTRFGEQQSKLLADVAGRPVLERAVAGACAVAELERVLVVLGARSAEIRAHIEFGRAETTVCPDWASGQSASLAWGLTLLGDAAKVIVTLGDAPLITPDVIRLFVAEPGRTRAVFAGRPGHPVVLGPEEIAAGRKLTGDHGARELLGGAKQIEAGHLCSGRDVDTPDDLEAIRDEARAVI
jgi:CTP:molybdopterin cytidylyltransferase MocA